MKTNQSTQIWIEKEEWRNELWQHSGGNVSNALKLPTQNDSMCWNRSKLQQLSSSFGGGRLPINEYSMSRLLQNSSAWWIFCVQYCTFAFVFYDNFHSCFMYFAAVCTVYAIKWGVSRWFARFFFVWCSSFSSLNSQSQLTQAHLYACAFHSAKAQTHMHAHIQHVLSVCTE